MASGVHPLLTHSVGWSNPCTPLRVTGGGVFAGCWQCRWNGQVRNGRGSLARVKFQCMLHVCRSPKAPREPEAPVFPSERHRVVAELERIAGDPNETPARRAIAERALADDARGSLGSGHASHLNEPMGTATVGNHRGGYFMQATIDYQGDRLYG